MDRCARISWLVAQRHPRAAVSSCQSVQLPRQTPPRRIRSLLNHPSKKLGQINIVQTGRRVTPRVRRASRGPHVDAEDPPPGWRGGCRPFAFSTATAAAQTVPATTPTTTRLEARNETTNTRPGKARQDRLSRPVAHSSSTIRRRQSGGSDRAFSASPAEHPALILPRRSSPQRPADPPARPTIRPPGAREGLEARARRPPLRRCRYPDCGRSTQRRAVPRYSPPARIGPLRRYAIRSR
jgi:hypothetical protein